MDITNEVKVSFQKTKPEKALNLKDANYLNLIDRRVPMAPFLGSVLSQFMTHFEDSLDVVTV